METAIIIGIAGAVAVGAGVVMTPAIKYSLDQAPFLYANARVSARTGFLLNRKRYNDMMTASSEKELFTILDDTHYHKLIEHSRSSRELSSKLEEELLENYLWLERFIPSGILLVFRKFRIRFEIIQLKQILNAIKNSEEPTAIRLVADQDFKARLEGVRNFNQLMSAVEGTRYSDIFAQKTIDDLQEINTALDESYIRQVQSEIGKQSSKIAEALGEYWRIMIDLSNFKQLVRKISSKEEGERCMSGGNIPLKKFEGVASLTNIESVFSDSIYSGDITNYKPLEVELGIYRYLKKAATNLSIKYNLEGGPLIRYIILKELEIRNLNVVLKLKEEGFKAEDIQKYVVT